MSGYGEQLRTYRVLRKLSQEDLAEQTGLPLTAISKIEGGTRKVELGEAVRLAEVLRISLAQLAGLDQQPPALPSARLLRRAASWKADNCSRPSPKNINSLMPWWRHEPLCIFFVCL